MKKLHFIILLTLLAAMKGLAQPSQKSQLVIDLSHIVYTGNHQSADIALMRRGAEELGVTSLAQLAEIREKGVCDLGERQLAAAADAMLDYAVQTWGKDSREAVESRRLAMLACSSNDWTKSEALAAENVSSAETLYRKHQKDVEVKLLWMIAQLDHLLVARKTGVDDPTAWEKALLIEKELEPMAVKRKPIGYYLLEACGNMANFKYSNSHHSEYIKYLERKLFPKGHAFAMAMNTIGVPSNALGYAQVAYEEAKRLWGDSDTRTINYRLQWLYIQSLDHLADYDQLHDTLQQMEDEARANFPENDLLPVMIEMQKWDLDVAYNTNVFETIMVNKVLRLMAAHYGEESMEYLNALIRLVSQQAVVNPARAGMLAHDTNKLIDKLFRPTDVNYGLLHTFLLIIGYAQAQEDVNDLMQYVSGLYDNYRQNHQASWPSVTIAHNLAVFLAGLQQMEQAADVYDIALADMAQLVGKESPVYAFSLTNHAMQLTVSDDPAHMAKGEQACSEAVALYQHLHIAPMLPLFYLNNYQVKLGKYEEGVQTLKRLLEVDDHADDAFTTHVKLLLAWQIQSYHTGIPLAEADRLFDEAKKAFWKTEEDVKLNYIADYVWIGQHEMLKHRYDEAERVLTRGLKRYEQLSLGVHDATYVDFITSLYSLYIVQQQTDKAEQLMQRGMDAIRNDPFANRLLVLDMMWQRLQLLKSKGTDDMVLWSKAIGEFNEEFNNLNNLSGGQIPPYYLNLWLTQAMEFLYTIDDLEKNLAQIKKDPKAYETPEMIAAAEERLLMVRNLYGQLLPVLQTVEERLKARSPRYLDENSGVVEMYRNYATYYLIIEKDTVKAGEYYEQLTKSADAGVQSAGLWSLANLKMTQGKFAEAAELLERQRQTLGRVSSYTETLNDREMLNNMLSVAYFRSGQYEKALLPARTLYQARQQRIGLEFDLLTQAEREDFVNQGGAGGMAIFALLEKMPERVGEEAYDAILAEKGLLLRASERISRAVRASGDASLMAQMEELERLKAEYKKKSIEVDWMHDNYDLDSATVALKQQIVDLERVVNREVAKYVTQEKALSWKDVQGALKEGEAAVEFVSSDSIAGALVLLPTGTPQYVSLTNGFQLRDQLSELMRMSAKDKARVLYEEDRLHLYERLWKPLEAALKGVTIVYFSPIYYLNELAFHAFKLPDGSYLTDHYNLHQMLTTGEVCRQRGRKADNSLRSALLMGGVFYSDGHEALAREMMRTTGDFRSTGDSRGAVNDDEETFGFLPYTNHEVDVADSLLKMHRVSATLLSGRASTEKALRDVSGKSPDILHLSTHGFYVGDDDEVMTNKFLARYPQSRFQSMQRAGLALYGANATWDGTNALPEDADGILTANEVARLDLTHTQLAVLSACQTAVGYASQEGVFGTHRGFKQAGVRSILATLWNVNDRSTAILMETFYKEWLEGKPMQQALHDAVNALRKVYSHPFYWAPYVMIDGVD